MELQTVNVHPYLESRSIAMRVGFVAPMRLDDEFEAFVRLARENITESVGVAGNVTNDLKLLIVESGASLLPKCASRIKGTQRYGKSFTVESASNGHETIDLQNFSIMDNALLQT